MGISLSILLIAAGALLAWADAEVRRHHGSAVVVIGGLLVSVSWGAVRTRPSSNATATPDRT